MILTLVAGGILYPIIFHRLFDQIGFAWTCRAIGLVILVTIAIPITVFQLRVKPSCKRKLLDLMAFREPAYTFFVLGGTLEFISLNIPFYYIQYFAISEGITTNGLGFYLLSILTTLDLFWGEYYQIYLPILLAHSTSSLHARLFLGP